MDDGLDGGMLVQPQKRKKFYFLIYFLQGMLVGTGAILPGVSGGVLCVAFGIYEPMMEFLNHPFVSFRKKYRLFIPLLLGGMVGFVLLAKAVEWFLAVSATAALALFSGLICGTVPGLLKKSAAIGQKKGWNCFIITLIASFTFFHLLEAGIGGAIVPNMWWYLFCGFVWGLSMVIPGLSSSSILLFMGLYQPMAQGIGNLDFMVLIPLGIGFLATIAAASRLVNYLLQHYAAAMSRIILGFVISSVLMITPTAFAGPVQLLIGIGCFAGGYLLSWWMDRSKKE